jgi:hypothetical protein
MENDTTKQVKNVMILDIYNPPVVSTWMSRLGGGFILDTTKSNNSSMLAFHILRIRPDATPACLVGKSESTRDGDDNHGRLQEDWPDVSRCRPAGIYPVSVEFFH